MTISYNDADALAIVAFNVFVTNCQACQIQQLWRPNFTNYSGVKNAGKWCRIRCWTQLKEAQQNTQLIRSYKTIFLMENSARSLRLWIIYVENKALPFLGRWLHLSLRKAHNPAYCPLHQVA